jgi:hypothetical protein
MVHDAADNDNDAAPEQGTRMGLFIFKSTSRPDLRAFGVDLTGSQLPKQFSPWHAVGAIAPDKDPPHGHSRDVIEPAIGAQLANIACQAKKVLDVDALEAVADRGYYSGQEIFACHKAGIAVTLPKPMTSGIEARGRFGKQDVVYLSDEDAYRCPAGEKLNYHYTNEEDGQQLQRYWTNVCRDCVLKPRCTSGKERRITRWEHEHVLEAAQKRLDKNPQAMRVRRETVEHTFGTLKMRMGAAHFLMKRLPKVASEMALHVLAYNLTRVINIMGTQPLMAAIRA